MAYFILFHSNRYERVGVIFKITKDHFYYSIIGKVYKLNKFLEKNELLIYDIDFKGRTLLTLSILANNYQMTQYLLIKGIYFNELGKFTNFRIPNFYWKGGKFTDFRTLKFYVEGNEMISNLIENKRGITFSEFKSNYNFGRVFHSNNNLINKIYEDLKKN